MELIPDATLHVTQLSEVLLLVRDVARQTLHPKKSLNVLFDPASCSRILTSMRLILRHVKALDDSEDSDTCRQNVIMFIGGLIKMQAEMSFQLYSTQLEAQLVDLIGEFVQIDPTGQWAEWSGQFYNMCASGMLTDLTYKCSSIDGST